MNNKEIKILTKDQRITEISEIIALGFIRLRERNKGSIKPSGKESELTRLQGSLKHSSIHKLSK